MRFEVDPQKKAHWNDHWERDWVQGKVAIGIVVTCAVVLAVSVALLPSAFRLMTYPNGVDAVALEGIAVLSAAMLSLGLGAGFLLAYLRHKTNPQRQTSRESMAIEDGYLWLLYHRNVVPNEEDTDVAAADLSRCDWWYDPKRRFLAIHAMERGAIRAGEFGDRASAMGAEFGSMAPADYMVFYPFYTPDLRDALRGLGVPEATPEEAARRTRWMSPPNI